MSKICHMIAGGVAVAFLAVPAFGQSKMNMNDCSKIVATYQAACAADNNMRTQCNTTSNPTQCYNTKKAAASNTTTTATAQKPAATPAAAKPAAPAPATPAAAKPATPAAAKPAAPAAAKPAAPVSTDANIVSSVPQGARNCATDGKKCLVVGNWTGVYGANNTFAKISGSGDFICDPKTLKISDPVPKVQKTCWVIGAAPAAAAKTPVAAAQPKVNALPLSCAGGLMNNAPKKTFTSQSDFSKWYGSAVATAATSLDGATEECRSSCAKTGEPAPCGWYTLVKWREDSSATGKSRMVYTCYKVNARSAKDGFTPTMAKDKNFGSPSNGLYFSEAYSYPCTR